MHACKITINEANRATLGVVMTVISDVMCAAFRLDAKSCVACAARNTGGGTYQNTHWLQALSIPGLPRSVSSFRQSIIYERSSDRRVVGSSASSHSASTWRSYAMDATCACRPTLSNPNLCPNPVLLPLPLPSPSSDFHFNSPFPSMPLSSPRWRNRVPKYFSARSNSL